MENLKKYLVSTLMKAIVVIIARLTVPIISSMRFAKNFTANASLHVVVEAKVKIAPLPPLDED